MSSFFINRPIVAMVIAILTVLGGLIALRGLPLAQFPEIVPPQIIVSTKMFQTCGSATLSESGRTINAREGSHDHPSAALPLLPRKRYCQAWSVA